MADNAVLWMVRCVCATHTGCSIVTCRANNYARRIIVGRMRNSERYEPPSDEDQCREAARWPPVSVEAGQHSYEGNLGMPNRQALGISG